MRWFIPFVLVALPLFFGCNKPADTTFTTVGTKIGSVKPSADSDANRDKAAEEFVAHQEPGAPAKADKQPDPKAKEKPRKIRYTADMKLVVDDLDKATKDLKAAMKEFDALEGKSEVSSAAGAVRMGTWRIRVAVAKFDEFRDAVLKIGKIERNTSDSEDMTAQYYDLQADIENRKAAREALRDLLKETGKKEMKHYLEVWDKLESVSGEINRKEGQLRLWADLTDLTTVTVTMHELQKFDAPKKVDDKEIPSFGMRADKTWTESWDWLLSFCQGAILIAIAITPWLPFALPIAFVLWLLARFTRKSAVVELVAAPDSKKP